MKVNQFLSAPLTRGAKVQYFLSKSLNLLYSVKVQQFLPVPLSPVLYSMKVLPVPKSPLLYSIKVQQLLPVLLRSVRVATLMKATVTTREHLKITSPRNRMKAMHKTQKICNHVVSMQIYVVSG